MLTEWAQAARRLHKPSTPDRAVRAALRLSERLLSERGVANGMHLATELLAQLQTLDEAQQLALFGRWAQDFNPDAAGVLLAAQQYAQAPNARHLQALTEAAEPPRQELLRRLNRAPGGTAAIVRLRHALLKCMPRHPELAALEADLLHLLSSWFNPGFLRLQQVDWNTPAQLLEQVIRHEAVHEIDGWDDLRRRLQPDRRCFAFFHPQLPDEPLIFVEVALLPEMPAAIAPLIDKNSPTLPATQFKVATFYSISNCQPGLRGVNLGNFLIKQVAQALQRELPQIKTFCTLSPIPSLMRQLQQPVSEDSLSPARKPAQARLRQAWDLLRGVCGGELKRLSQAGLAETLSTEAQAALLSLTAHRLVHHTHSEGGDPVARFHLDNGARLERINLHANLSERGLRESAGLMVNYLYDLSHIETRHQAFTQGEVAHSRAVSRHL